MAKKQAAAPAAQAKPARKPHPNRYKFTQADCVKGFWAAIESIIERHPDAIMPDGRHMANNFLTAKRWRAKQNAKA